MTPDYAPITLRRVALLQDATELHYYSLYATILVCFVALMVALYTVKRDIFSRIEGIGK